MNTRTCRRSALHPQPVFEIHDPSIFAWACFFVASRDDERIDARLIHLADVLAENRSRYWVRVVLISGIPRGTTVGNASEGARMSP
jgi:hypothetical protein